MLYYSDFFRLREEINFILDDLLSNENIVCYEKEAAENIICCIQNSLDKVKERNI